MYRTTTLLVTAFMLVTLVTPALAADIEDRWGVTLEGGLWKLVEGYWDHSNVDNFTGLGLRRGMTPNWTLGLNYRYGTIRPGVEDPTQDAGWTTDHYTSLYTEMHNTTLSAQYIFLPDRSFRPFLGLGLGATAWRVIESSGDSEFFPQGTTVQGYGTKDEEYHKLSRTDFTIATELGVEWFLSDAFSLNFGGRYHILPSNYLDNVGLSSWDYDGTPEYVDANKGLVQVFLGATLWFGGNKDSDGDGIANKNDLCPDDPEDIDNFEDHDGCPDPDNDGDGILDVDDPCPLDPEDHDGFQDEDGCPDPDNDGDGIMDGQDQCPDEAEDFDGFQDEDGCPDLDNDGDGVPDTIDRCDGTPAGTAVDEFGCPKPEVILAPAIVAIEEGLILEDVTFQSGSAQLTAESIGTLSKVADSLNEHPTVRVEVRGHTDSTGSAETNRDISHRRAMAVRDVLIQLGISASRVTAVGYGEDYPIAPNDTREGRAKNRRVELHRIN